MTTNALRPTVYFVEVVNRDKLERALTDLKTFDIEDCLDYIDCKTLRAARKTAALYKPVGVIYHREDIRPVAWDYSSSEVVE